MWAAALVATILVAVGFTATPPPPHLNRDNRKQGASAHIDQGPSPMHPHSGSLGGILALVVQPDTGDQTSTEERARGILRTWGAPGEPVQVRILGGRDTVSSAERVRGALAEGRAEGLWSHFLIVNDATYVVGRNIESMLASLPPAPSSEPRIMGSHVKGWLGKGLTLAGEAGVLLNLAAAHILESCEAVGLGEWDAWLAACWRGGEPVDTRERAPGTAPVDVFNAFGPVRTARAEMDERFVKAKLSAVGGHGALLGGQHRWCCATRPVTFGGVGALEADALHEILGGARRGEGSWLDLSDEQRLARWPPEEQGHGMDWRPDYADPVWDFLLFTAAGVQAEADSCLAGVEEGAPM